MAKVIAVCGKICSGKTYYSNQIKSKENAVILSCDELTKDLFNNNLGDKHDEMAVRIRNYFKKKSAELVNTGCNVILDWGFWSADDRKNLTEFYNNKNIICEWHYIDVDDITWQKNIGERNEKVLSNPDCSDYYLDEGLMEKLLSKWEAPAEDEIDVWFYNKRQCVDKG